MRAHDPRDLDAERRAIFTALDRGIVVALVLIALALLVWRG